METAQSNFKEEIKQVIRENITQVVSKINRIKARMDALENKVQKALHERAVRFESKNNDLR